MGTTRHIGSEALKSVSIELNHSSFAKERSLVDDVDSIELLAEL